jgi:hypothetical protein
MKSIIVENEDGSRIKLTVEELLALDLQDGQKVFIDGEEISSENLQATLKLLESEALSAKLDKKGLNSVLNIDEEFEEVSVLQTENSNVLYTGEDIATAAGEEENTATDVFSYINETKEEDNVSSIENENASSIINSTEEEDQNTDADNIQPSNTSNNNEKNTINDNNEKDTTTDDNTTLKIFAVDKHTNDNTPSVNVELPTGTVIDDIVTIYDGNKPVGTKKVTQDDLDKNPASVDIETDPLNDGPHKLSATITDTAGNESPKSDPTTVTVDTAPTKAATDITLKDDNGQNIPANSATKDATPTAVVTLPSDAKTGDVVKLFDDGKEIGETVLTDSDINKGVAEITPTTDLANGDHSLSITITDVAGNESPNTTPITVKIDDTIVTDPSQDTEATEAPKTPTTTDDNNNIIDAKETNDNTPSVNVELPTGTKIDDTVTIYDGNKPVGTKKVTQDDLDKNPASVDIVTDPLNDGPHKLSATITDTAGNESPKSDPTTVTVDTAPTKAPTDITLKDDNGQNIPANSATKDATPTAVVTLPSDAKTGDVVKLFDDGKEIGETVLTDSDINKGVAEITPTTDLANGDHPLSITITDVAGNESPNTTPITVKIDDTIVTDPLKDTEATEAPKTPTATDDNNNIIDAKETNDNTPSVNVELPTGTKIDDIVTIYDGNKPVGTKKVTQDDLDKNPASVDIETDPLNDGPHKLSATITDTAGNESPKSDPTTVTVDTAPTKAATDITLKDDNGQNIPANSATKDATPTAVVTLPSDAKTGDVVKLFDDGKEIGETVLTDSDINKGVAEITPTTDLANGDHPLSITITDVAGNESPNTTPITVKIDDTIVTDPLKDTEATEAPKTPTATDDNNNIIDAKETNDDTPSVNVELPTGTVIDDIVTIYDGNKPVGTKKVTQDDLDKNPASVDIVTDPLNNGPHKLSATITDTAGNESPKSNPTTVTVDTAPTKAPTDITLKDDNGQNIPANSATKDATPTAVVTLPSDAKTGDVVKLFDDGKEIGETVLTDSDINKGVAEITPTTDLANGDHPLSITITDVAGNESPNTTPITVKIDDTIVTDPLKDTEATEAPKTPTATDDNNNIIDAKETNDDTPSVNVELPTGTVIDDIVTIYDGNKPVGTKKVTQDDLDKNPASVDIVTDPLNDGPHKLSATITDTAGNESPKSDPTTVTVDTAPTKAPTDITLKDDNGQNIPANSATKDATPTAVVTLPSDAKTGDVVKLFDDGKEIGETVLTDSDINKGVAEITPTTDLANGDHPLSITITDVAGNESPNTTPITVKIDDTIVTDPLKDTEATEAPKTPTATDDNNNIIDAKETNDDTPSVNVELPTGTVIDDIVTIYDGNKPVGTKKVTQDDLDKNPASVDIVTDPLNDGPHKLSATITDTAGNESPKSDPTTVTVDTAPTKAPTDITLKDDNGQNIPANSATKDATPTAVVTLPSDAKTGDVVKLFDDGKEIGETVLTDSDINKGVAEITPTTDLANGDHPLSITITDVAGNESPNTTPITVKIDDTIVTDSSQDTEATEAPKTPTATDDNNNIIDAKETNDDTPSVNVELPTGTVIDDIVTIYDGNKPVGTKKVTQDDLDKNPASVDIVTDPLNDGPHKLSATITDTAGNESPKSNPTTVTVDTAADSDVTLSFVDTGSSTSDTITNDNTVTLTNIDSDSTYKYSLDNGTTWKTGTGSSFELENDTSYAENQVQVEVTDIAGNVADIVKLGKVTTDNTADSDVTLSFVDTGSSASDTITNDNTVTLTNIDSDSTYKYSLDNGTTWKTGTGSSFELENDTSYAENQVQVEVTDIAGNVADIVKLGKVTTDNTADSDVTLSFVDTGSSASDTITNDNTVTLTNIDSDSTYKYSLDNGTTWKTGTGSSFELENDTSYAENQVQVEVTDIAGNVADIVKLGKVTTDNTADSDVTLSFVDTGSSASDTITNDNTVTLTNIDSDSTYKYSLDNGTTWKTGTGSSFELENDTSYAENQVQVEVTDIAGNVADIVKLGKVTTDNTADSDVTLSFVDTGSSTSDTITNDNTVTLTNIDSDSTYKYSLDNGTTWKTGTGSSFELENDTSYAENQVQVEVTDIAGNVADIVKLGKVTTDNTADSDVTLSFVDTGSSASDTITNDNTVTLTNIDSDSTYKYSLDNGTTWKTGTGSSFELENDTSYAENQVQVEVTDIAGNVADIVKLGKVTTDNNKGHILIDNIETNDIIDKLESSDVLISGTTVDIEEGEIVSLKLVDSATPSKILNVTTTVKADGTWTLSGNEINMSTGWAEGNISVSANVSDKSGNVANEATKTISLDTKSPVLKIDTLIMDDNYVNQTEKSNVTISGQTANVSVGTSINIVLKDESNNEITKTAVIQSDGSWKIDGNDLSSFDDGSIDISASHSSGTLSDSKTINLDTEADLINNIRWTDTEGGKGNSYDLITSDNFLYFKEHEAKGWDLESTSTFEYTYDNGVTWHTGSKTLVDGNIGFKVEFNETYNTGDIKVRTTDVAGNIGTYEMDLNYKPLVVDNTKNFATVNLLNDTGTSNTDQISQDGTISITNVEDTSYWYYRIKENNVWGDWSSENENTTTTLTLGNGIYDDIEIKTIDVAGNDAISSLGYMNISNQNIDAPKITKITDDLEKNGIYSYNSALTNSGFGEIITDDKALELKLDFDSIIEGDIVKLYINDGTNTLEQEYTITAADVANSYANITIDSTKIPTDGIYNISTKLESINGKNSPISSAIKVEIDTVANEISSASLEADTKGSHVSNGDTDQITSNGKILVTGLDSDTIWKYRDDNSDTWKTINTTIDSSGNSYIELPEKAQSAPYDNLQFISVDKAGNESSIVYIGKFIVDQTGDDFTVDMTPYDTTGSHIVNGNADKITSDGRIDVADVVDDNSAWYYKYDGVASSTTNAVLVDGSYWFKGTGTQFTLNGQANNEITYSNVTVMSVDRAGNTETTNFNDVIIDKKADSANASYEDTFGSHIVNGSKDTHTQNGKVTLDNNVDTTSAWYYKYDGVSSATANSTLMNVGGVSSYWIKGSGNSFTLATNSTFTNVETLTEDRAGNQKTYNLGTIITDTKEDLFKAAITDTKGGTGTVTDGITSDKTVSITDVEPTSAVWYQFGTGAWKKLGIGNQTLTLADNFSDTIKIKTIDIAGNSSTTVKDLGKITVDVKEDLFKAAITDTKGGTGTVTDGITSDKTVSITDVEPTSAVWYQFGTGAWKKLGIGNQTLTLADNFSDTIKIKTIDIAGNSSTTVKDLGKITVDINPDNLFKAVITDTKGGTGTVTDGITYDKTVSITDVEPTSAVWYQFGTGAWKKLGIGNQTLTLADNFSDTIKIKTIDIAGNSSTTVKDLGKITVDINPDNLFKAVITDTKGGTGTVTDGITYDKTVSITDVEPTSAVWYQFGTGAWKKLGIGNQTLTLADNFSDTIKIKTIDIAGNSSTTVKDLGKITVDINPDNLFKAVITDTKGGTGTVTDGITYDKTVSITDVEPTSAVWYQFGTGAWKKLGIGNQTLTLADNFSDTIKIKTIDIAGNSSTTVKDLGKITVDVEKDLFENATGLADTGSSNTDGITYHNELVMTELKSTTKWEYQTTTNGAWYEGGTGNSTKTLADGTYDNISIKSTDIAGNTSIRSFGKYIVDTSPENMILKTSEFASNNNTTIKGVDSSTKIWGDTGFEIEFEGILANSKVKIELLGNDNSIKKTLYVNADSYGKINPAIDVQFGSTKLRVTALDSNGDEYVFLKETITNKRTAEEDVVNPSEIVSKGTNWKEISSTPNDGDIINGDIDISNIDATSQYYLSTDSGATWTLKGTGPGTVSLVTGNYAKDQIQIKAIDLAGNTSIKKLDKVNLYENVVPEVHKNLEVNHTYMGKDVNKNFDSGTGITKYIRIDGFADAGAELEIITYRVLSYGNTSIFSTINVKADEYGKWDGGSVQVANASTSNGQLIAKAVIRKVVIKETKLDGSVSEKSLYVNKDGNVTESNILQESLARVYIDSNPNKETYLKDLLEKHANHDKINEIKLNGGTNSDKANHLKLNLDDVINASDTNVNEFTIGGDSKDTVTFTDGDDWIKFESNMTLLMQGGNNQGKFDTYVNKNDSSVKVYIDSDITVSDLVDVKKDTLLLDIEELDINFNELTLKTNDDVVKVDLSNGQHNIKELKLEDLLELTNDTNDLVFVGDNGDSIDLSKNDDWEKSNNTSSLENEEGQYFTYTNVKDPTAKLFIDEDINVI